MAFGFGCGAFVVKVFFFFLRGKCPFFFLVFVSRVCI